MIAVIQAPTVAVRWSPYYTPAERRMTQAIVIHATCGSEGPNAAQVVAAMFAAPGLKPKRSCHEVVDSAHVVQCVPSLNPAWHCGHTGNQRTYGIEICGLASQDLTQWHDQVSLDTLARAAARCKALLKVFELPCEFVDAEGLLAGKKGITAHAEVSKAWHESDHTDPGPAFPWDEFLKAVAG